MPGVYAYKGFYAIHDHMQGAEDVLRIGGTVEFRTGGWSAELRPTKREGNPGINPFIFYVDLVLSPPPEGSAVTEALTEFELPELRIQNPALEYHEVLFRVVGSPDEEPAPERVYVEHPK
jgi:hypothetical protein